MDAPEKGRRKQKRQRKNKTCATSILALDRSPIEKLPVQVIGNILSRLGAARNVVIASATCRKWQDAWNNHVHTLTFNSMPNINILEKCCRKNLQVLKLAHNTITGVEPSYQKFPCLKSLSLSYVSISARDLSLLLAACPKIEELALVGLDLVMSDSQATTTVELMAHSLKDVYVEAISLDKFILEADGLENLHLKDCKLDVFELIGKGVFKFLKIDGVSVNCLEIGESGENLETVDVRNFTIAWEKFYQILSRALKLRKLWLWDVVFDNEDGIGNFLCAISSLFPLLSHLCLNYDVNYECSFVLENVIVLELGWTGIGEVFSIWLTGFLDRFPRLRKLVLHGPVSKMETYEKFDMLVFFKSSVVRLMRMYLQVEVLFVYDEISSSDVCTCDIRYT